MADERTTPSGIPVEPFYDGPNADPGELGAPGSYPFTRGVYRDMYRGRPWT
ncbi:MAG: methylmalonyl-CoA mutase family protein, partial [Actinomycetota bacterium]